MTGRDSLFGIRLEEREIDDPERPPRVLVHPTALARQLKPESPHRELCRARSIGNREDQIPRLRAHVAARSPPSPLVYVLVDRRAPAIAAATRPHEPLGAGMLRRRGPLVEL